MARGTTARQLSRPKYTRDLPEERRRKLIEAAMRCLAERGLAGTSVREIAVRADVSPGLVGHHFAGKEDLVAQTYDYVGTKIGKILDDVLETAGDDPEDRLRAFVDASFRPPILDSDLLAVWITFWSLVRTDARIHTIHRGIYADYRRRLESLIAAIAERRRIAIEARLAALSLTAMLDGLWLEWCLDPSAFTAEEACRAAQGWVDGLIGEGFPGRLPGRRKTA
jgi:AcrR family transcriptional regulator